MVLCSRYAVNALPHGKARRIRSAHATDGLQFEGGSTLSLFYSRAVHTADKPRSSLTPDWQNTMIAARG